MSELDRQKMVIDDFKLMFPGALAFKQSHRFLAGVADLKLASKSTGTWEFEVKHWQVMPTKHITLPLSDLQRSYGRKCIAAGINWGWLAIFKDGVTNMVVAGSDPEQQMVYYKEGRVRPRGGSWLDYNPIDQIYEERLKWRK